MSKNKKTYFFAEKKVVNGKESIYFTGQDGTRGHRAGYSPVGDKGDGINFILEKLIELNGIQEGMNIYQKFNEALIQIGEDDGDKRSFPKSCLVFFKKDNDNKIS